jgi:uncharacterized protein YndB with AHSA1/START domain
MKREPNQPLGLAEVVAELEIAAPPQKVWSALVGDVSSWWHSAYFTGAGARGFHIEPKLGGRMHEDWGGGQGLVWGTVIGLRTNEMLQVVGDSSPEWGGPSRSFFTWKLSPTQQGTNVRFSQSIFGRVDDAVVGSLDAGWRFLFGECLKRYVETGTIEGAGPPPAC